MAALTTKICDDSIVTVFADVLGIVNNIQKRDSVMTNLQKIITAGEQVGGSTNGWLVMDYLLKNRIKVDRIFILSDMQCYDTGYGDRSLAQKFQDYKRTINPLVMLYSWNMSGYSTFQFPENDPNVVMMAGWSDKALDFIVKYEMLGPEFIETIKNYTPKSLQDEE